MGMNEEFELWKEVLKEPLNRCYICGTNLIDKWHDDKDLNHHLCAGCGLTLLNSEWAKQCHGQLSEEEFSVRYPHACGVNK